MQALFFEAIELKKYKILILLIIFGVAFFLRFYKLGEIPYGFYQDESAIGYNAYSILQTGRDEYGKWFPLYFKSFGDYKLPLYIYSTVLSISTFGVSEFAVRFPSAIFSFLTVIIFYFWIKDLSKSEVISLVSTSLLAINPWHLHYGRATFEVSICLFFLITGAFLLQKSFEYRGRGFFVLGSICFIVSLYGYNLTRLLAPLLYIALIYFNLAEARRTNRLEFLVTILIAGLLIIPFVLTFLASGGLSSASGTLIFSSNAVYAPLLELRSYFVEFPFFITTLFSKWILIFWRFLQNIVLYFSTDFFYVSGSSHGNHGIGNVGQFYLFEIVTVIAGIYYSIQRRIAYTRLFLLWAICTVFVASLTREAPHATRSFFFIPFFNIFSSIGLIYIFTSILKLKKTSFRFLFVIAISGFIFYNIVYYFMSYYVRFPIYYAKSWRSEDKALVSYIEENKVKYEKIIFDDEAGFVYTSFLFFSNYPPSDFQVMARRLADDSEGFSKVVSFGKYEFRKIDWSKDLLRERVLIVTNASNKPDELLVLKTFYYPRRPVVFSVKEKIVSYPVEEIAYMLVETK